MKRLINKSEADKIVRELNHQRCKENNFYNIALKEYKGKKEDKIWLVIG